MFLFLFLYPFIHSTTTTISANEATITVGAGANCNSQAVCDTNLTCLTLPAVILPILPDFGVCVSSELMHSSNSSALSKLGEFCLGKLFNANKCEKGLECELLISFMPELGGICVNSTTTSSSSILIQATPSVSSSIPKVVGKGQHCGGNINNAPVCESGLTCILSKIADIGGTCR